MDVVNYVNFEEPMQQARKTNTRKKPLQRRRFEIKFRIQNCELDFRCTMQWALSALFSLLEGVQSR